MSWKKEKQRAIVTSETNNTDREALLHQAYMLVRHLRGCYSSASSDEELRVRLSCLFDHTFSPQTVERLLEALCRPFAQTPTQNIPAIGDEKISVLNGLESEAATIVLTSLPK